MFAVGDVATLPDCLRGGKTPLPRAVQCSARRSQRRSAAAPHCIIGGLLRGARPVITRHKQGTTGRLDFAGPPPSDGNFCGGYAPHKKNCICILRGFPACYAHVDGV